MWRHKPTIYGKVSTPGVGQCTPKCHSTGFPIHLTLKSDSGRVQTAASLECVGGVCNWEPVHSQYAGGSQGRPL